MNQMIDAEAATQASQTPLFERLSRAFGQSSKWSQEKLDSEFKGLLASAFKGLSPIEMALSYLDWLAHLSISPGKQAALFGSFVAALAKLQVYSIRSALDATAEAPYRLGGSFDNQDWQRWPFNVLAQLHQSQRDWWLQATSGVEGVSDQHEQLVQFLTQEFLAALSPVNSPFTNPTVLRTTREERGGNLLRGLRYLLSDSLDKWRGGGNKSEFVVGDNIACTPGKVVYQNDLLELIQYAPMTDEVDIEPVFIVPPWIMKFYILDLSPKNSMIKYLLEQGKTVFAISWKNPRREDRDVSFMDYLTQGLFAAMAVVNRVCPGRKLNAVGYCLGGTLLCIAAAAMARDGDDRLNSITLFASQADFSEAGEITRFISESQLMFLEKLMWRQGVLDAKSMGSTFAYLRSDALVYNPMVDRYLLGKDQRPNDLMAWNADGTRMPARMHSEYLRSLYLNNELATHQFKVDGRTVHLSDIRAPVFNLGTETDHVAPWQSVYKVNHLVGSQVTFCLTSGGHNAGVISGPSHPRRHYRISTSTPAQQFVNARNWLAHNEPRPGSWWPAWIEWLNKNNSGEKRKPPAIGAGLKNTKPLRNAPGEYVHG